MTTPDDTPVYTRLELEDQVRIAADHLRSAEEEHYREYLDKRVGRMRNPNAPSDSQLDQLRTHLKALQDRHSQS